MFTILSASNMVKIEQGKSFEKLSDQNSTMKIFMVWGWGGGANNHSIFLKFYWFNYWHTSSYKGTSSFTSNTFF